MTDNIDDDEALFDDIYEDDSKSEVKAGEKKNENEEKKPDEKPGSGNSGINSNNNEDDRSPSCFTCTYKRLFLFVTKARFVPSVDLADKSSPSMVNNSSRVLLVAEYLTMYLVWAECK